MDSIEFKLEWLDKRRDGTPFPDSWVSAENCNLPEIWEWLMTEVILQPAIALHWEQWEGLIRREAAAWERRARRAVVQR